MAKHVVPMDLAGVQRFVGKHRLRAVLIAGAMGVSTERVQRLLRKRGAPEAKVMARLRRAVARVLSEQSAGVDRAEGN